MSAERITMTMDDELAAGVRAAARRAGVSVSAWLTEAAAAQLRNDLLGAALDKWEQEQGPFTEEELAHAAELLGLGRSSRGSAA